MNGQTGKKKAGPSQESKRWEDVRRKLAETEARLTERTEQSPEERRRLLKDRARALAEPEKEEAGKDDEIVVVEFDIAREHYAVESRYVREVIPVSDFTPIPGTPPVIMGVVAVRGRIVSLICLRQYLGLPPTGIVNSSRAVLLADDRMEFAVLADRVIGIRSLNGDSLQPSVTAVTGKGAECLLGVAPDGLIVCDGEKILADPGIVVRSTGG
jgi:purine-binding chemotaxis protein CheW